MRKVWINCSEASGDMYAGALTEALLRQEPSMQISGMGGPMLAKAGADVRFSMNRLCFTGFIDVLLGLPGIFRLHREITAAWKKDRPDAVIMVDCPDFNLPLAKSAHAMGIPVYYFMAPQFWAWKQQGIKTLRECVHTTLCALPFEPEFLRKRGCQTTYAGHPLHEIIPFRSLDKLLPKRNQIGIMPGSRQKEISFLLPEFAKTAQQLRANNPALTFHIARAPGITHEFLRRFWPADLPQTVVEPKHRYPMIRQSAFVMSASGTATLETALIGTPTIVAYKLDTPAAFIARKLAYSKLISLPNILLQEKVFPEFLQEQANAEQCYRQANSWLHDQYELNWIRHKLKKVRTVTGPPNGLATTANTILNHSTNQGEEQWISAS